MTSETATLDATLTSYANLPWVKAWSTTPVQGFGPSWSTALNLIADRLEEQAGFIRQFSQCSDPATALQLSTTYTQTSMKRLWDDNTALFEGVRSTLASAGKPR
ncbi:MAG: phasin family protein [Xanthobacter sp.]